MNETRVNLKHLLEDIRDSYPLSLEEVIINELIANALDSGASRISFYINLLEQKMVIVDNGKGMRRKNLRDYHNIAATTKARGKGIGFAGIGAKLSLLIAESVITETKGGRGSRAATAWHLSSDTRAPWKFIPFAGEVKTPCGTAVSIVLSHKESPLLSEDFVRQTIINHYFPFFISKFYDTIFRFIYKKGIEFFINDKKVIFLETIPENAMKMFRVNFGRRTKQPVGFGYITNHEAHQPFQRFGLAVSTYGKIIKYGWEWLGITPKSAVNLCGIVEIPALSEILTINKMDFLRDASSLKKYYRYRKAIQEAVFPILETFGEKPEIHEQQKEFRPLVREIERTLRKVIVDFPELLPLLGIKRISDKGLALSEKTSIIGIADEEQKIETAPENIVIKPTAEIKQDAIKKETKEKSASAEINSQKEKKDKGPAIFIDIEQGEERGRLARIIENRILVNLSHPAYQKAQQSGLGEYHTVLCIAWILSQFLEESHSPHEFINQFFSSWGKDAKRIQKLLKV